MEEIVDFKKEYSCTESTHYQYRGGIDALPEQSKLVFNLEKPNTEIFVDLLIVADKKAIQPRSLMVVFNAKGYAAGCKAKMKVRIITFKNTEITVLPQLIVENNDVEVDHSVAIGPIDKESSFYLKSRGVSNFSKLFN